MNLNGTADTIRAFAPALVKGGSGRIIVVSSMQGRYGTRNGSSYSASKWGIIGLMKSVALEPGEHRITVNAVIPGLIDTPMTRNEMRWKEGIAAYTGQKPDNPTEAQAAAALTVHVPLGVPWLTPDQVAPVAMFLASDAASMVTGAAYEVTGGDPAHDQAWRCETPLYCLNRWFRHAMVGYRPTMSDLGRSVARPVVFTDAGRLATGRHVRPRTGTSSFRTWRRHGRSSQT